MPDNPPRQLVPTTGNLNALAALLFKPELKGVWYNSKDVTLDGIRFVECRFDNCTLRLSSTEFSLERCFIATNCRFLYGPSAGRVIQLFMEPLPSLDARYPTLAPTRHEDGTITIGGS